MSRLIDEKSVIEISEKHTFTDKNERRKYLDFVRYCVEQSKTAYNVDKVVEELACNSRFIDDINEHNIKCISCVIGQKTAIDIVRKGGME